MKVPARERFAGRLYQDPPPPNADDEMEKYAEAAKKYVLTPFVSGLAFGTAWVVVFYSLKKLIIDNAPK